MTTRIDIVSDVVCPWCIVGYLRLDRAVKEMNADVEIHWHPFELNTDMPAGGENLRDHLMRKYGITADASVGARDRLVQVGKELDFHFEYSDDMRIVSTLKAHQLLHFARKYDKEQTLKLRLFDAYFTECKDIEQDDVLIELAVSVGLPEAEARQVLREDLHRDEVRAEIAFYRGQGLSAVPAFIFNQKYLVSGAQDVSVFKGLLEKLTSEALDLVEPKVTSLNGEV
jgi:predicted DsbA family dithiol-disulfide isomerase